VRYTPYIALSLAGLVLGIVGAVSLGIGAVYGGLVLFCLPAIIAFALREREAMIRERPEQAGDAHRGTSTAATR
jgi:hypothetical protein